MKYTVVGVYADNDYQRYATWVEADSPENAEALVAEDMEKLGNDLIVAGVFEGELMAVDK